jgi:tetratricopeptide (TPR) repeat protein
MFEREPDPSQPAVSKPRHGFPALPWLLGIVLVAAVVWVGSPALDAPWIQGDERIFIANNPDVTDWGRSEPTGFRPIDIFLHKHEDLYQPFTILTYALQWAVGGANRVFHIRLGDVLIHALNALLLWAVLRALLTRLYPLGNGLTLITAWALALVWAVHPMLVGAFAADMGRTHLLAATFIFLSLLLHLKSLKPGGWGWFIAAYIALLLAMLNKPMVGWIIVVFVLEWVLIGLRRTLLSPRVYLIGLTCALFALLTLWTTQETFLLEDSPLPIFGDPLARAALGLCIYVRNFVAPLWWITAWYPPDIHTGWGYPLVWLGVLILVAAVVAALLAARHAGLRGVTLGLMWFLGMWLPVSGLVGARVLAAQDRYMYQPMVGLLLAIGIGLSYWLHQRPEKSRGRSAIVVVAALLFAGAALPWDLKLCRHARSTLQRAERVAQRHPDDPRVTEFLAAAYDFCRDHDTYEARLPHPPDFRAKMATALQHAADLAEAGPQYFGTARNRAEFHRRLSYDFWNIDLYEASLAQAQRAHDFEPEEKMTWVRLAHAYRGLGRWEDTRRAYEQIEALMPPEAPDRGLRLVEHADLLLNRFDDPSKALYKFREALAIPDLDQDTKCVAILGAARCEVLAGEGRDGFQLAMMVLQAEPDNLEAARIIALYHLRSHNWEQAGSAYRAILRKYPTDYEALRGFQNVCVNTGNWTDAAFAWQSALEHAPQDLIFRAHFVWSAACTGERSAAEWARDVLETSPDNRFACLALMLLAIRAGELDQAREWIERARHGPELPLAREFARAEATLRVMLERQELPPEAVLLRAALCAELGSLDHGRQLVRGYLEAYPDSPHRPLAEQILERELRDETAP